MAKNTIIPFGPQHPVLPEPIQLRLVLDEERVVSAIPVVGYVHRGLEKLAEQKDFLQDTFLIERICGICSFIHSLTYSMGIESMMGLTPPPRAQYLRVIWSELHRMHSHLLAVGLLADAFGFENLFMQLWRTREHIMDAMEATTGARVMLGTCCPGGVRKDIDPELLKFILTTLVTVEKEMDEQMPVLLNDYSVKQRLCGVGILDKQVAYERGAVGPTARASGIAMDLRTHGYAAYGELDVEPMVETDGDCYARTKVRVRELYQSMNIVRKAIGQIPSGPINVPFKTKPDGEVIMRAEQPRGEVLYYLKGNGSDMLERLRVRTPTFANIPPVLAMLAGCELADVGVIVISIDPCISCTER
ncbi:MAG: nickel-dependent hydrogenase large subunit [Victivallaceae bacterium]|jgi:Ni,Fe-hydrogenase III large subunit